MTNDELLMILVNERFVIRDLDERGQWLSEKVWIGDQEAFENLMELPYQWQQRSLIDAVKLAHKEGHWA